MHNDRKNIHHSISKYVAAGTADVSYDLGLDGTLESLTSRLRSIGFSVSPDRYSDRLFIGWPKNTDAGTLEPMLFRVIEIEEVLQIWPGPY